MKRVILILVLAPLGLFSQDRDKVKFVVSGLTCSMCSLSVQNQVKGDSSLKYIDPNLETQTWYAEYSKGNFELSRLKKGVEDAGFTLERAWLNDKQVYERKRKREYRRLVRDLAY